MLNLKGIQRIVINPCWSPSTELPKIGAPKDLVDTYAAFEPLERFAGDCDAIGFFGDKDELLGDRYHKQFLSTFGNMTVIPSGHHISDAGARIIASRL